ncbi:MAG: hypothetical protein IKU25_00835 [Clostridia bacterium]|nr:hypothetical protein [Clostridia bacterium]
MKKKISLVMALVLVLSVLAFFSGCSIDKKVIGNWKATIDMSSMMNDMLKADGGEEMAEYFTISDFKFDVILTFNEDGTCKSVVDETTYKATMDKVADQIADGMVKMLEDMFKEANIDMTVEEYLASQNMTMDDLTAEMKASFENQDMSGMETEGTYVIEDKKIIVTETKDGKTIEEVYEYVDGTIKVVEMGGLDELEEEEKAMVEFLLKTTFTKA